MGSDRSSSLFCALAIWSLPMTLPPCLQVCQDSICSAADPSKCAWPAIAHFRPTMLAGSLPSCLAKAIAACVQKTGRLRLLWLPVIGSC